MCGVRDLDPGERVEVETAGVGNARPSEVAEALRDEEVYIHLDLDVLDPEILPSQFAVPHGLSDTGLRTLLGELRRSPRAGCSTRRARPASIASRGWSPRCCTSPSRCSR